MTGLAFMCRPNHEVVSQESALGRISTPSHFFARGCARVIHLGRILEIEMRIDLCRGDAGVAEHFPSPARRIARGLQHVRGRTVEHVRMHVRQQTEQQRGSLRRDWIAHRRRRPLRPRKSAVSSAFAAFSNSPRRAAQAAIASRALADRDDARLAALAEHADSPAATSARQFTSMPSVPQDAGRRIEEFEDGLVAQIEQVVAGRFEQGVYLVR